MPAGLNGIFSALHTHHNVLPISSKLFSSDYDYKTAELEKYSTPSAFVAAHRNVEH